MGQCGSMVLSTICLAWLTGVYSASSCVLNDDYCDCGWDEPTTSACAGHHSLSDAAKNVNYFLCLNPGAGAPAYIAISRVNDGTCDCCDGADESGNRCGNRCDDWRHALERNWQRWNGSEIAHEKPLPTIEEMQKRLDAEAAAAKTDGTGLFKWKKKEKQKLRKLKKTHRALWEKYVMNVDHSKPATANVLQLLCYPSMTRLYIQLIPRPASQNICNVLCRSESSKQPVEVPAGQPTEPLCIFEIPNNEPLYVRVEPVDDVERALLESSLFFSVQRGGGDEENTFFTLRDELAMISAKARHTQKANSVAAQNADVFRQTSKSHHFAHGKHTLFGLCLELKQLEFNWSTANMEQWRKVHYKICFFSQAVQKDLEDANASPVLIGYATGALTFADGQPCGDIRRSLEVKLSCGSTKLHEVRNVDKCTYEAYASHPSACRPLGPYQGWKGPPLMPGDNIDEFPNWLVSDDERVGQSTKQRTKGESGGEWVMWESLLLHSSTFWSLMDTAKNYLPPQLGAIVASIDEACGLLARIGVAYAEQVARETGVWAWYLAFLRDFESQYPQHAQKMPQEPLDMLVTIGLVLIFCCFGWQKKRTQDAGAQVFRPTG